MNNNEELKLKKFRELLLKFSKNEELIELLELYFAISNDSLDAKGKDKFLFEATKLRGITEFKKILLDFFDKK